jgi:uncharacterized membrane protein YtjA (UPF0391 family)
MAPRRGTNAGDWRYRFIRVWATRRVSTLEDFSMLGWAITFLVIALVAGLIGFGFIASASAGIAKLIFFAFIVLFVLSLVFPTRSPPAA